MALAVENHPQKAQITEALLSGIPLRAIAATLDPPLHFTSLQRYKLAVVKPAVRNAHALAKVLAKGKSMSEEDVAIVAAKTAGQAIQAQHVVDPYLARIAQHQETIDAQIAQAEDGKTVAALIGVDLKGMELNARLDGRLDSASGTTNNYIVVNSIQAETAPRPRVIDIEPEK